jgi:hypothetical protein
MTRTDDMEQYARSYIDAAFDAQRRLGGSSDVPTEDYEDAVRHAASAFEDLVRVRLRSSEREPVASN